ncbi:acyltransferase family protein [Sphingomonas nostoxanthinifaciens]|uniref:acyltransferase family protein n=1 Tax=Sphingomonas nostoxanthinifaciens TaxID=2872652 RepID=UPI001CC20A9C|nr:acyltransferase [Sphingomonas nostoxanthinifaciens]UAK26104.1 acyltransferase [Sphingomonas nostoxanthinifaciens]
MIDAGIFLAVVAASFAVATILARALKLLGLSLPDESRRIGCIDGLRGYLALGVCAYHFARWLQFMNNGGQWVPLPGSLLNSLGPGAVALFFMVTGCVFYPQILRGARVRWVPLYIGRLFRIYPLVLVSIALIALIIVARTAATGTVTFAAAPFVRWLTFWDQPPLLGYDGAPLLNAKVLWSLWYELLFYTLVLPACILARQALADRGPTWVIPAGLLVGSLVLRHSPWTVPLVTYLPLFAIGMLAFELRERRWARSLAASPACTVVALISLLLAMLQAVPYAPISMILYGLFFVAIACGNDLWGTLRTSGAIALGECSFGIYLLHGIVLDVAFVDVGVAAILPVGARLIALPILIVITVLVATCAYALIERPGIRAGRKLAALLSDNRMRPRDQAIEVAP